MRFEDLSIETRMNLARLRLLADEGNREAIQLCEEVKYYKLLLSFYNDLEEAISHRRLLAALSYDVREGWSSQYDRIRKKDTGISFFICDGKVRISLGNAKLYVPEYRALRDLEVDFAELKVKSELVWQETVPILAKSFVQRLNDMILDAIPHAIYGLEETEKIKIGFRSFHYVGSSMDEGGFTIFSMRKIAKKIIFEEDSKWLRRFYQEGWLDEAQVSDFTREINALVSHADISFSSCADTDDFVMKIAYDEEKTIPEPVFDYAVYYKKYAELSPELEEIFDEVAKKTERLPVNEALKYFDTVGRLACHVKCCDDKFSSVDWKYFGREILEKGKHRLNLVERIEKKFPNLIITKTVYDDTTFYKQGLIVFEYEFRNDVSNDVVVQYDYEDAIRNIITNKSVEVVKTVVDRVLNAAISGYSLNYYKQKALFDLSLGKFDERLKEYEMNILQIENDDWCKELFRIQREMTGETLCVGFTSKCDNLREKIIGGSYSWDSELHA